MHFLSVADFSSEELEELMSLITTIKKHPERFSNRLKNKTLVLIFEKPSTRTRVSFEQAILQLGGHAITLRREEMQLGRGESIADSARVLSRYVHAIMARVYNHESLVELAKYSTIPVINGLSDLEHPCQIVSDLFTVYEEFGSLEGIKLAYVGDGNNVCNSLLLGCALLGVELRVATPKNYRPSPKILKKAIELNPTIQLMDNPAKAVERANVVYTDVWVSMGDEGEEEERVKVFKPYQVNTKLLSHASPDVKVMHCLPAHRGLEITDEVIDGHSSIVWTQAENRLHAQKAILLKLMK